MTNKEREAITVIADRVNEAWDFVTSIIVWDTNRVAQADGVGSLLQARNLLREMLQAPPRKAARKADGNSK